MIISGGAFAADHEIVSRLGCEWKIPTNFEKNKYEDSWQPEFGAISGIFFINGPYTGAYLKRGVEPSSTSHIKIFENLENGYVVMQYAVFDANGRFVDDSWTIIHDEKQTGTFYISKLSEQQLYEFSKDCVPGSFALR